MDSPDSDSDVLLLTLRDPLSLPNKYRTATTPTNIPIPILITILTDEPKLPPVPVTILTVFLGSGKTTLVQYILDSTQHGKRVAVIENKVAPTSSLGYGSTTKSEAPLSVETMIALNGTDSNNSSLASLIELPNGCLCCTVKDSLIDTLELLLTKRRDFDYMLIKCSGLANTGPIVGVFWLDDALESRLRLDGIVCLVDCGNIKMQLRETAVCGGNGGNDGGGGGEAAQ
mmetsp:Transcript_7893/g.8091  ORF Transcript_7893/g.8091 Transcript_7893/m.8091 type:complete len:229 (-) Transcript_7893:380-1066(-)